MGSPAAGGRLTMAITDLSRAFRRDTCSRRHRRSAAAATTQPALIEIGSACRLVQLACAVIECERIGTCSETYHRRIELIRPIFLVVGFRDREVILDGLIPHPGEQP